MSLQYVVPIIRITIEEIGTKIITLSCEDENSYSALVKPLKIQRLRYFSSASFVSVHSDRILNYEDVLSEELFNEWQVLLENLGVVNQMYLYAMKMGYLYRLVILKSLKINEPLFVHNLRKRMGYIDSWNGIQDKLFDRLK